MNLDSSTSSELALLPQYGFGATYAFDALVEHHHFLYRVHTPKRPGTLSRPASPSPRARSPFHRPELTRSPSSLSSSVASIRTADIGASDYFTFVPGDEDDSASGDPYFLSRRFKDDLTSPDPGRRRRTLSTLSTLSGASTAHSYIGSDDGSDVEYELGPRATRGNLSRSTSMMLGHSRVRSDSMSNSRPDAKRSQSADIRQSALPTESTKVTGGANMTYADLVRHLDWTTRSSSPYVTTSFSFFWCLWEAVRRYKLGVKHDVEIAVIDARKVRGRAKTALEVLRNVEADRQDKAYWKWFRFAQESQDVLVFGAIPGDAIYASIPLTQILPKLPSYFFVDDIPKPLEDPREPDADIDPRSPSSRQTNPIFPSTPGRPETPNRERERERERKFTAHLLTTLAWDIGTTLRPTRKSKDALIPTPGKPTPRHTSHADFCKALSASFTKRSEADQLRDATTGVVNLAELLVEPWFRARCAEGAAYLFRHDDDDEDELDDEKDANADRGSLSESVCLGLAGDGCALEHSHDSSIQDALFGADKDDETEEEAAKRDAAGVLSELALSLARWPANWWYEEHAGTVEGLVGDVVSMCVTEAARGVQGRIAWGIALAGERERRRTSSMSGSVRSRADSSMNLSGSLSGSLRSERRGREETRERERERSRSPFGLKQARRASEGSPSPKQLPLRESPYKPRARSPLGTTPALGPAIVIRPKSKPKAEGQSTSESKPAQEQEGTQAWSPSTPPPSPPLKFSVSEGNLGNVTPSRRKSPPHPPPPRSNKRPPSPSQYISSSLASLDSPSPSPNSSPSASLSSSLLKRSVQRRAESLPGGWPGDESPREERSESPNEQPVASKKEEGDVFWDPAARSQTKARPLSWAGSGMALGAVSSAPSSVAGSQKSSVESLRNTAQSSPSSSPSSSILRQRPRTSSDAQVREALLTEVVSSALGLGAGIVAGVSGIASSGSPLRLDTSSSSSSGSERSLGSSHHRRHSSHGHVHPLDIELSPVREVEQEDEVEVEVEAEQGNVEGTAEGDESVRAFDDESVDASVGHVAGSKPISERAQANGVDTSDESKTDGFVSEDTSGKEAITSGSIDEVILADQPAEDHLASPQGSGTSTPRSERRRSRSGTLASIPEENWTDWSLVEAPTPSELDADANQREASLDSSVVEPVDIPLPPSPSVQTTELSDDVYSPLPGVTEPIEATKAGEEQGASSKAEVRQVPEITLTTDTAPSATAEEQSLAEESNSLEAGAGTSKAEEKSNALTDSRHFGLPVSAVALARTRTLMRTFIALPVVNLFRSLFPGQESRFPSPSPVFEDTDAADAYLRVSPFFSFFRIPIRATTRFFRRRRQELRHLKPGRSMAKILSPPAAWNSPILDSYPYAEHSANGVRGEGGYWDDQDTNWVMSCFVCGVMATLALASIQQQRCEMHMMVGNRLH